MDTNGREPRVMVVGSTMTDMLAYAERLPDRGETVRGSQFRLGFGGKGANQAVMAALLGARVSMVNRLGADVFADSTLENFRAFGIDVRHVRKVEGLASGVAPIWVEPDGANRIIVIPGANDALTPTDVDAAFNELERPDVVLCQLEIPQECVLRAFERGRAAGSITVLNPAPAAPVDPRVLGLTSWLVPNEPEFAQLAASLGEVDALQDLVGSVTRIATRLGCGVLVTLGERGALFCEPNEASGPREIAPPSVVAVDSTGAGDAFLGAFAYGLAVGATVEQAVRMGCACGAASVTQPGTQTSFPRGEALAGMRGSWSTALAS